MPRPPHPNDPALFNASIRLPDGAEYVLDDDADASPPSDQQRTRLALRLAWASSRPLLVVGEAGSGKSELAQALASAWKVPLLSQTVHSRSEAQDLMYHFDAVQRLADAQVYQALRAAEPTPQPEGEAARDALSPERYLRPGPLWWHLSPHTAHALNNDRPIARRFSSPVPAPAAPDAPPESVVLIDEVDKGSDELTEGLLDVLDTQGFDVAPTGGRVGRNPAAPRATDELRRAMVILTSNGARELPAPFVRRCIVLPLGLPEQQAQQLRWLVRRGRAHFSAQDVTDEALKVAAELIYADRSAADLSARYKPGLAEYLYLLKAVSQIAKGESGGVQSDLIRSLGRYVTEAKAHSPTRA